MKKILKTISIIMVLTLTLVSVSFEPTKAEAATTPIRVLFIGNSKTASYGSPAKSFEALAKYNNKNVEVTVCAEGGKTLNYFATTSKYRALITKKSYDYVIMQEGISPYLGRTTSDYNAYEEGVKKIVNLIKTKNKNAKFFLRQVWVGREYGTKNQIYGTGQSTGKFWYREDKTCTSAEKVKAYRHTEEIAKSVNATVIYDGWAMGTYNNRYIKSEDGLFQKDKYHQTELGSDLAATAIYAAIYKKMPNIGPKSFQHGAVKSLVKSEDGEYHYYNKSANNLTLTTTQINRIKSVINAKYSFY